MRIPCPNCGENVVVFLGKPPTTGGPPLASRPPVHTDSVHERYSGDCCPDCGTMLEFTEGCLLCRSCGYSKC